MKKTNQIPIIKTKNETISTSNRCYTELLRLISFEERYNYLKLVGLVGETTFGFDRYLNQMLYTSKMWLRARDSVIVRDNGCDLGVAGYEIHGRIIIHHMNPINIEDIENGNSKIINPEFLICTSHLTHLSIHFGNRNSLPELPIERSPGDTIPWKKQRRF
jgi:hypothetical protein